VRDRFEAFASSITPERVLAALKREAVPLKEPLLRFRGRKAPSGGEQALRAAWQDGMRQRIERPGVQAAGGFAYADFGPAGQVVADSREPALGIRTVRFANGVRLNLKQTTLEKDQVLVRASVDGGDLVNTRENPTATEMARNLVDGGLGRHSEDDLQTILAGRTVAADFEAGDDRFVLSARTTPRDLALQLQVLAATLADPGYRPEGELRYRHYLNTYFARLRATPTAALRAEIGGILSDNDPRFTLQPVEAYRKLTFAKLKADLADRLAHGAIEIGLAGDIDEDRAIALVAATFGALPAREDAFRDAAAIQPPRPFTANRAPRIVRHKGPADQAMLRFTWPTRDDGDPVETLALELLERVSHIELTEILREKLGKAYSPAAASSPSRTWRGFGTFGIAASVATGEVAAAREAIVEVVSALRTAPVDEDTLRRARQPLIEEHANALKTNGGWLGLVARAQSEAGRIERYLKAGERLMALTPADVMAMARRYLDPAAAVEIAVLPQDAASDTGTRR